LEPRKAGFVEGLIIMTRFLLIRAALDDQIGKHGRIRRSRGRRLWIG
jgi:hypothetical protein